MRIETSRGLPLLAAFVITCATPGVAQLPSRQITPPSSVGTPRAVQARPQIAPVLPPKVIQGGAGQSAPPTSAPPGGAPSGAPNPGGTGPNTGSQGGYQYNPAGFPVYPGPNANLPTPGTYYDNPNGSYNPSNPYNPYGYYNSGLNGYQNNGGYDNGSYSPPNPYGNTYPSYNNYNSRTGR